jgi:hypothetical protein
MPSYNDFITHYKNMFDWAAFIDVDEYIVLKEDNNIKSFIEKYSAYDLIAINWRMFDDNNLDKVINDDYRLIDRFIKCQKKR